MGSGYLRLRLLQVSFFASAYFFAAIKAKQPAPSVPSTTTSVSETGEEKYLKEQIQLVRDYDQKLLNTVNASLGAVFLLVVLIGGLNWFTNYRLYERERDALRQEIRVTSREEAAGLEKQFLTMKATLDHRADELSASVDLLKGDVTKEISGASERLSKITNSQLQTLREQIAKEFKGMEHEHLELAVVVAEQVRKVPNATLTLHLRLLQIAIDVGYDFWMGDPLQGMRRALEQGAALSYATDGEIKDAFKKLPEQFSVDRDTILQFLAKARHF